MYRSSASALTPENQPASALGSTPASAVPTFRLYGHRRGQWLLAGLLTALLATLGGCGSEQDTKKATGGPPCAIDSDCPAGTSCGASGYCGSGAGTNADGANLSDSSFAGADAVVAGGDAGTDVASYGDAGSADATDTTSADAVPTSCVDRCGSLQGGCACNSGCKAAGNCCDDYTAACEASTGCKNDFDCNDKLSCTTDSCVSGVCSNTLAGGNCLIAKKCIASGVKGPGICSICTPSATNSGWTTNVGGTCDDGKSCTSGDVCSASGTCAGKINGSCCTKDSDCGGQAQACKILFCNSSTKSCDVKSAGDGVSCDDGDSCTEKDACATGLCLGKAKGCDDGDPCTTDSCAKGGCVNTALQVCSSCWDAKTQKIQAKGTVCGSTAQQTENRCSAGGDIEMREAFAGCTGSSKTCSKAKADQIWQAWKASKKCTGGQACVEKVKGQPGCVITGSAAADLTIVGFKTSSSTYVVGKKIVVSGKISNVGNKAATPSLLEWRLSSDAKITKDDMLFKNKTITTIMAGGTVSIINVLTLPKTTKPGVWYVGAIVDAKGQVAESDESNNTASYKITVSLTPPSGPDLLPISYVSSKSIYVAGTMVGLAGSVKNQGTKAAGAFKIEWWLSKDAKIDAADTLVKSMTRTNLAAGASTSVLTSTKLSASLKPGTYYIVISVDSANAVKETKEDNNIKVLKIVVVDKNLPDLMPQYFSATKSIYAPGASITVLGSVKNQGLVAAGSFSMEWRLSTDATINAADTLLSTKAGKALAPGKLASAYTTLSLPANTKKGTYYLGLWVDRGNKVTEAIESNNIVTYKITVDGTLAATADLLPIGFKSNLKTYAAGSTIKVYGVVKNQGKLAAKIFLVEWRLSTNQVISVADKRLKAIGISSLAVGASKSIVSSFTLPIGTAPGTYYLAVWVNRTGVVKESNRGNNKAVYMITVTKALAITRPELEPTVFKSATLTLKPGALVTINTTIKNNGTTAPGFSTAFYLSTNNVISKLDTLLRVVQRFGLSANGTTQITTSLRIPSYIKPGTYYLAVQVDHLRAIAEGDETNNVKYVKVTVAGTTVAKADLIPYDFSILKKTYKAGDTLVLTAVLKNQGTVNAGSFKAQLLISTNNLITSADTLIVTRTITALDAGYLISVGGSFKLASTLKDGTYYFGIRVDSTSAISESNELNNVAAFPFVVKN